MPNPWDEYAAADTAAVAVAPGSASEPWKTYAPASEAPATTGADKPWDDYTDPAARISQLKSDIADWQKTAQYEEHKARALDYVAQAVDLKAALHHLVNLPNRLAAAYQRARGLVPADYVAPDLPPVITPEQGQQMAAFLNPLSPTGGNAAIAQGLNQGAGSLISGLTTPENLAAMVVAKRYPEAVGRFFQGEMLGGIPASVEQVAQAQNTPDQIAAALGAAANVALPAAIERGLQPGRPQPTILSWEGTEPEAPSPTEFAPEARPPLETLSPTLSETSPAPAPAPVPTVASLPGEVTAVPAAAIATRPELMQFKRMDNTTTGVNKSDQLTGQWDPLKAGNLLLWEPADPAAAGLTGEQRYIVANGHHRFEFGAGKGVPEYNAQIIREADGISAQDARALAAEINIADGKGTIYDQVKFLRNESATHGPDAALARAGRLGVKGRQATTLAFQAGDNLYTSFLNEQITPEAAEAIAKTAPNNDRLQRLGIKKALDGAGPAELQNFLQAVQLETKGFTVEQFDLFGNNDAELSAAERLAARASEHQRALDREIRATDNAVRNVELAKAKGLRFERDPEEIRKENVWLRVERRRWENWALHPDLVEKVRDQAVTPRLVSSSLDSSAPLVIKENTSASPGPQDLARGSQVSMREEPLGKATERATISGRMSRGAQSTLKLPVDAITGKRVYQPVNDVNELLRRAEAGKADLDQLTAKVAQAVHGARAEPARVKQAPRLMEKLQHRQPAEVSDYSGARITVETPRALAEVNQQLARLGRVVQVDSMLVGGKGGYRAVHYQVELPNGLTAELQVVPKPIRDVMRGGLHKTYAKWRNKTDLSPAETRERNAGLTQMADAYRKAYDQWFDQGKREMAQMQEKIRQASESVRQRLSPELEAARAAHTAISEARANFLDRLRDNPQWAAAQRAAEAGGMDAGQARLEAGRIAEQVSAQPRAGGGDLIEQWLTHAIEATNPLKGQALEGVTGAPVWLGKSLAHATLQVVRAAYRAGKTVAQAAAEGLAWLRAQNVPGFNAEEATAWLANSHRAYGLKVADSPDLSESVKSGVSEYLYTPRSNETDAATAQRIIQERGLDQAIAAYKDDRTPMPGAVRSMLGDELVKQMATAARAAEASGNRPLADQLANQQVLIIDADLRRSTEIAQSLQAMRRIGLMSASGMVRGARRIFLQAGQSIIDNARTAIDQTKQALDEGNRQAAEETMSDPAVNRAASEAVDAALKTSDETRHAITVEIAGDIGQSPEVMRQLHAKLRSLFTPALQLARSDALWPRYARGAAGSLVKAAESLINGPGKGRAILDQFTNDLTRILRDQLEQAIKPVGPGTPITPRSHFAQLLDALKNPEKFQDVWARARAAIAEKFPDDPRAQQLLSDPAQLFSPKLLGHVLADQLHDLQFSVSELVNGHYTAAGDGRILRDKIMERLGLDETSAADLARALDAQFKAAHAKASADLSKRLTAVRAGRQDRLIRAAKSGVVDLTSLPDKEVDRVLNKQLNTLGQRLGDLVRQSVRRQDTVQRTIGERVVAEAGLSGPAADRFAAAFDRRFQAQASAAKEALLTRLGKTITVPRKLRSAQEKLIELSNLGAFDTEKFYNLVREKFKLPTWSPDLAREINRRALAVEKIPEGFQRDRETTRFLDYVSQAQGVSPWDLPPAMWYANVLSGISTPAHVVLDNVFNLAGNTLVTLLRQPLALPEVAGALVRGTAKGALQSAEILKTGITTGVRSDIHRSGTLELNPFKGPLSVLNNWKYVGRLLSATHVLTFAPARELRWAIAARDVAKTEGLSGPALTQRVADLLANTEARTNAAKAQAAVEGTSGLDFRRRVGEILEQQRESALPGSSETSREFALRSTYLNDPYGVIGIGSQAVNTFMARVMAEHPRLGFLAKTVVPFTKIIGNLVNEKLNWTPIGAWRAARAQTTGRLYGQEITDPRAVGDLYAKAITGTIGVAALTAAAAQYLHDPDPVFAITGNGPADSAHRKQLEETGWRAHSLKFGGRYFSYLNTPAAVGFAVVGNYLDAVRYKAFDDVDALNRAAYTMKASADVLIHQSFLDGLAKTFEGLGNPNAKHGGQQLANLFARNLTSFVVPTAIRQIDQAFDPRVYDRTDLQGLLTSQVPFVRRLGKPALNVLGEPVELPLFGRDTSPVKPAPLWQAIAVKQAWIPAGTGDVIIGAKKDGPGNFRVLTPDEHYEFVRRRGQFLRAQLNPSYLRSLPPVDAQEEVRHAAEEATRDAKDTFPQ